MEGSVLEHASVGRVYYDNMELEGVVDKKLFVEFARGVVHRHAFVDNLCKFCQRIGDTRIIKKSYCKHLTDDFLIQTSGFDVLTLAERAACCSIFLSDNPGILGCYCDEYIAEPDYFNGPTKISYRIKRRSDIMSFRVMGSVKRADLILGDVINLTTVPTQDGDLFFFGKDVPLYVLCLQFYEIKIVLHIDGSADDVKLLVCPYFVQHDNRNKYYERFDVRVTVKEEKNGEIVPLEANYLVYQEGLCSLLKFRDV